MDELEVINCTDGQKLADAVAVECMGWELNRTKTCWVETTEKTRKHVYAVKDWQPHLPTEKGKAQAIDLAAKYNLAIHFDSEYVASDRYNSPPRYLFRFIDANGSWQIAVLQAALFSQLGEDDE